MTLVAQVIHIRAVRTSTLFSYNVLLILLYFTWPKRETNPRAGISPTLVARLERYFGTRLIFEIENILVLQRKSLVRVSVVEGTSEYFSNAWLGVLI